MLANKGLLLCGSQRYINIDSELFYSFIYQVRWYCKYWRSYWLMESGWYLFILNSCWRRATWIDRHCFYFSSEAGTGGVWSSAFPFNALVLGICHSELCRWNGDCTVMLPGRAFFMFLWIGFLLKSLKDYGVTICTFGPTFVYGSIRYRHRKPTEPYQFHDRNYIQADVCRLIPFRTWTGSELDFRNKKWLRTVPK